MTKLFKYDGSLWTNEPTDPWSDEATSDPLQDIINAHEWAKKEHLKKQDYRLYMPANRSRLDALEEVGKLKYCTDDNVIWIGSPEQAAYARQRVKKANESK